MSIMKVNDKQITSIDAIMDSKFGKAGTPERELFRREAYAYCMGRVILDACKGERITQCTYRGEQILCLTS